eukprot:comp23883_c0_seq1/m.41927 comp23883_c0_seq1/g.41927  ORF comp23883_c0_seq1/g.41927 comp23883_c0_seq1/m.41927 type:complete len:458 (-) comp23883_c0_seq1:775-2148(-)
MSSWLSSLTGGSPKSTEPTAPTNPKPAPPATVDEDDDDFGGFTSATPGPPSGASSFPQLQAIVNNMNSSSPSSSGAYSPVTNSAPTSTPATPSARPHTITGAAGVTTSKGSDAAGVPRKWSMSNDATAAVRKVSGDRGGAAGKGLDLASPAYQPTAVNRRENQKSIASMRTPPPKGDTESLLDVDFSLPSNTQPSILPTTNTPLTPTSTSQVDKERSTKPVSRAETPTKTEDLTGPTGVHKAATVEQLDKRVATLQRDKGLAQQERDNMKGKIKALEDELKRAKEATKHQKEVLDGLQKQHDAEMSALRKVGQDTMAIVVNEHRQQILQILAEERERGVEFIRQAMIEERERSISLLEQQQQRAEQTLKKALEDERLRHKAELDEAQKVAAAEMEKLKEGVAKQLEEMLEKEKNKNAPAICRCTRCSGYKGRQGVRAAAIGAINQGGGIYQQPAAEV